MSFLKKVLLTGAAGITLPSFLRSGTVQASASTYDKLMDRVGYNHLPNVENITMNTVLHKADTRGAANHGWLQSYHSFSFANYHDPRRMNFGVLRVLNDDTVKAGRGFGKHPHDNMEIISIPLYGDLEHEDSMGNKAVIREGDVQVMSAGTGIFHSEYNRNTDKEVKFLQIWLFPNKKQVQPRYDQISLRDIERHNDFYQILSPNPDDQGVWVHQNAWFHLGKFDAGKTTSYSLKRKGNGVYAFILDGEVEIEGQQLAKRDGFGLWDTDKLTMRSITNSRVLLMEVPMTI